MTDEELARLIADNAVYYRRAKRWTQTDMAASAGLSQQVISRVENAEGLPFLRTINKLAEVLEVPIEAFFQATPTKRRGGQQ